MLVRIHAPPFAPSGPRRDPDSPEWLAKRGLVSVPYVARVTLLCGCPDEAARFDGRAVICGRCTQKA